MTTSIKFRALTDEDHKLFFEALCEHGKDFQNIQQYMSQRGGQRNNNASSGSASNSANGNNGKPLDPQEKKDLDKKEDDRKREQIRNFYNKLYAKLSELIGKIDDSVEKVAQELYLLINYGEIWKRNGFKFNTKTKRLLEELVYHGTTTFRHEKKNVRLRTPTCKALKKINEIGIDEKVKVVTAKELPKDVIVEFHPATNRDWLKVQSLSQNPRVRARLSMQKRLTSILDYLENKWDISQSKQDRNVDALLKNSSASCADSTITPSDGNLMNGHQYFNQACVTSDAPQNLICTHQRIRIKPSNHHELKEVNITRVVPDNHLDLSLNAYIKRLKSSSENGTHAARKNLSATTQEVKCDNPEFSSVTTNVSRLPVSLTTPDCSILFERSCTSDQTSIAKTRKHLNILQSLTGALEGCENSRTAYEDTQDRAPALYDEDAALPISSSHNDNLAANLSGFDSHNSKSVDFGQLPKNVTLGDYFKMTEIHNDCSPIGIVGDEAANDAFPVEIDRSNDDCELKETDRESEKQFQDARIKENGASKFHSHLIEIKKFADGWTRHDEPALTLGELYLAFRCPEKLILEYEFERYEYVHLPQSENDAEDLVARSPDRGKTKIVPDNTSERILLLKLLTAATLSLTKIERDRVEQQRKLAEQQTCTKLKRRKGSGQCLSMTLHDIEQNNQRVEEALQQLQPTRLSSYKPKKTR